MKLNPGVVSGIVAELDMANARVKVKFEWLHEKYLSNWARVAMPMAGKSAACSSCRRSMTKCLSLLNRAISNSRACGRLPLEWR